MTTLVMPKNENLNRAMPNDFVLGTLRGPGEPTVKRKMATDRIESTMALVASTNHPIIATGIA